MRHPRPAREGSSLWAGGAGRARRRARGPWARRTRQRHLVGLGHRRGPLLVGREYVLDVFLVVDWFAHPNAAYLWPCCAAQSEMLTSHRVNGQTAHSDRVVQPERGQCCKSLKGVAPAKFEV